ncbi:C-type lectin domain family 4 member M-like [Cyprinodon tularosa]|uniref:C-type lectin domain family 4 member M-like n=1 Tax=Cyprinodon tularosa TaxID=77115 RepID=UPI0018E1DF10|nr:C-type lectin domain family 4 member M-like [Cyprinodon tularosa]
MSFEYRASKITDMEMTNSETPYTNFSDGRKKLLHSVYALRNNSFKLATIGLGLVCVFLLVWIIGQSVHYENIKQDNQNKFKGLNEDNEKLQANLKIAQQAKKNVEEGCKQTKDRVDSLSKRVYQLQADNRVLSNERDELKAKQSQAEATSSSLNKELGKLKDSIAQVEQQRNDLNAAQISLQTKYDAVVKSRKELQANYDTVITERNNLQNKFNNVTRSRDQLQLSYNDVIKKVEELHDRYNFSISEKDNLSSSNQNLTTELRKLQDLYSLLKKGENDLQSSYESVMREKSELEKSLKNVTTERDLLKSKADNLTAEREILLGTVNKLNATIEEKNCTAGWKKFQYSCYFPSTVKKTWTKSREDCLNKGADLAIVNSREEMNFLNTLYSSDKEVWIGLTDGGVEGHWKWVDGTPLTLTFWAKGQPNSHQGRDQDCVEFWHRATGSGDWNDENCSVEQNWICEK